MKQAQEITARQLAQLAHVRAQAETAMAEASMTAAIDESLPHVLELTDEAIESVQACL